MHKPNAGATSLVLQMHGTIPNVNADRDQVIQVLTNLVQNAIPTPSCQHAARRGEHRRRLRGEREEQRKRRRRSRDDLRERQLAPGIAPEIAARLFEPYATTKPHGTGLGLAIAQRIALEHGGELVYAGKNGTRGAIFRLHAHRRGTTAGE